LTNGAPLAIDPARRFVSPRTEHLFGIDHLGCDLTKAGKEWVKIIQESEEMLAKDQR
jgi:hypothetical protein